LCGVRRRHLLPRDRGEIKVPCVGIHLFHSLEPWGNRVTPEGVTLFHVESLDDLPLGENSRPCHLDLAQSVKWTFFKMHFEDQAGRHIFYPWLSKARSEIAFGHQ